jgi:hypothetical protein
MPRSAESRPPGSETHGLLSPLCGPWLLATRPIGDGRLQPVPLAERLTAYAAFQPVTARLFAANG